MNLEKSSALNLHRALLLCALFAAGALRAESLALQTPGGELLQVHAQRVLRLKGGDLAARGFAHGYLLARESVKALESAISSLPGMNADKYEHDFLPWARKNFVWDADAIEELDGIYAGVKARLGASGLHSAILSRDFSREDAAMINVLADYYGPACSAFSAWGERTPDGKVVHGRTLDFPIGADAIAAQIIVACDALPARGTGHPARKGFVAIGWPGMITQYTGMNDSGLVVCIHDGDNVAAHEKDAGGCIARGLLLRRMLERVDPAESDAAIAGSKLTAEFNLAGGNLFHLSWPLDAAIKTHTAPSAVLEFDASINKHAAIIRRPEIDGFMVLTNHFCQLNHAVQCERCLHITSGIDILNQLHQKIGLTEARKLLKSAELPIAAHSIYFYPDTKDFYLALTKRNIMSPSVAPVKFSWAEVMQ